MRVHHLNCGTCCPVGGRLFDGVSSGPLGRIVCHCLLAETDEGLVLVDTGLGMRDVVDPGRISGLFRTLNGIRLRPEETAVARVAALGFRPEDVRHVVLTHLDFDHAGGLEDFPRARVHVLAREKAAADMRRGGPTGALRYRARQWDGVEDWALYEPGEGEDWFGFAAVRGLRGLPPGILMVPLAGHTLGHAGVAVDLGREGWLLHAGDAYFSHGEVGGGARSCPPGMRAYQAMMDVDGASRRRNQERLRRLSVERAGEVRVFCAHDPVEHRILAAA
jgi:glyoxylase-like metal-dependent hydrolase (beta-lactamase superfamily II)